MRKKLGKSFCIAMTFTLVAMSVTGCSKKNNTQEDSNEPTIIQETQQETSNQEEFDGTVIAMTDSAILVDGKTASTDSSSAVYTTNDIIYYEEGKDDTYGAGTDADAHTAEEAAKNTVVMITKPGTYKITGSLSAGQIAVDLGEDAKEDPTAVVTLVLDNANIDCSVAPSIVVIRAYECGSDDVDTAVKDVDTTNAGFNLIIADNSENTLNGSYVAKIYKEDTTKKKYKFDGTITSTVSMNINGEAIGNGVLNINAENEGISTDLHMTINGGILNIKAGDDSLNASEDSVSVITINGGTVLCNSGSGSEGDGIDANGWIVINDGYIVAAANPNSQDSGLDSDLGIYINGGTVLGSGNMYDEVSTGSKQKFMVLSFNQKQSAEQTILIKDSQENYVTAFSPANTGTIFVYSAPELTDGDYTMYYAETVTGDNNAGIYSNITAATEGSQLQYTSNQMMGFGGGGRPMGGSGMQRPDNGEKPEMPADGQMPADGEMPEMPADGEMPEMPADGTKPEMPADGEMPEMPTDETKPEMPEDGQNSDQTSASEQAPNEANKDGQTGRPNRQDQNNIATGEASTTFSFSAENYTFSGISEVTEQ